MAVTVVVGIVVSDLADVVVDVVIESLERVLTPLSLWEGKGIETSIVCG